MRRVLAIFLMPLVFCGLAAAEVIFGRSDCLSQDHREELSVGIDTIMTATEAERNEHGAVESRERYISARMDTFSSQSALVRCQATKQKDEEPIKGQCRKEYEHYLLARSKLETVEAQVNDIGSGLMKRMNERMKALREKYPPCN